MHVQVKEQYQYEKFKEVYEKVYGESGYGVRETNLNEEGVRRYLIAGETGYIGTLELKKYKPEESILESSYKFHETDYIRENAEFVEEIGKVAILNSERSKGYFLHMVRAFVEEGKRNGVKYYIALIDRALLIAIKGLYKFPIEKLGEKRMYNGHMCVPVSIDVEKLEASVSEAAWFKEEEKIIN